MIKVIRPEVLKGITRRVNTEFGKMYVTINEWENKPFEVFVTVGKSGFTVTADAEAIGRLVSQSLKNGCDVKDIINQLKGIGGGQPAFEGERLIKSIADGVAFALESVRKGGEKESKEKRLY